MPSIRPRNLATFLSAAIGTLGGRLFAVMQPEAARASAARNREPIARPFRMLPPATLGANRKQRRAAQKRRNVLANRQAHR